jgi:hypothetical protein
MADFKSKYLKYKKKYLNEKNNIRLGIVGGTHEMVKEGDYVQKKGSNEVGKVWVPPNSTGMIGIQQVLNPEMFGTVSEKLKWKEFWITAEVKPYWKPKPIQYLTKQDYPEMWQHIYDSLYCAEKKAYYGRNIFADNARSLNFLEALTEIQNYLARIYDKSEYDRSLYDNSMFVWKNATLMREELGGEMGHRGDSTRSWNSSAPRPANKELFVNIILTAAKMEEWKAIGRMRDSKRRALERNSMIKDELTERSWEPPDGALYKELASSYENVMLKRS